MACKKTIQEWEALFKSADKDNSGTLDLFELRDLLRKGDSKMTDQQIAEAFIFFDGEGGDRKINLQEFTKGLQHLFDFIKKVEDLFKQLDADNSGYLERSELRELLNRSGKKFTDKDLDEMIKQADSSGDGKISLQELKDACS
ncbi:neo-calmodulin [Aplysia californica]|uniref:Neo-calmodulin n=1 Tax=Aplysia californica TaxID=6500 RepID=A0ABM0JBZ7_APLCA|nr:neo-calmodulin [Aplysia californica]